MPAGFTEVFATRLNKLCVLEVREAKDGDLVTPGRVLIAPGDSHMKIKKTGLSTIVVLSSRPAVNGHRPSADVLFSSVAAEYGPSSVGVIMTGMGEDGAEGIGEIRKAGGRTLAQDENTCVVFGMPKAAIKRGYIDRVITLERMAEAIAGEIIWKGGRQIAANHE
jgi:two-component system chemotaxis response regulator CheB